MTALEGWDFVEFAEIVVAKVELDDAEPSELWEDVRL